MSKTQESKNEKMVCCIQSPAKDMFAAMEGEVDGEVGAVMIKREREFFVVGVRYIFYIVLYGRKGNTCCRLLCFTVTFKLF